MAVAAAASEHEYHATRIYAARRNVVGKSAAINAVERHASASDHTTERNSPRAVAIHAGYLATMASAP